MSFKYYALLVFGAALAFMFVQQMFSLHNNPRVVTSENTTTLNAETAATSSSYFGEQPTSSLESAPRPGVPRTPPVSRPRDENGVPLPDELPEVPSEPTADTSCVTGGCSGQLCLDASQGDMVSTCEWREVYACYQAAACERQADGQCGWTKDAELVQCLVEKGAL